MEEARIDQARNCRLPITFLVIDLAVLPID
jgi:hypothetical protein